MAYTTPRTWVAGDVLTAAQLNQHLRDNQLAAFPLAVGVWTAYTPTINQGATANIAKTVDYARYMRVGRSVWTNVKMTISGTGAAGGTIRVTIPVATVGVPNLALGSGWIFDTSAAGLYKAVVELENATPQTIQFRPTSSNASADLLGSHVMTAALAAGDIITYSILYEAAADA